MERHVIAPSYTQTSYTPFDPNSTRQLSEQLEGGDAFSLAHAPLDTSSAGEGEQHQGTQSKDETETDAILKTRTRARDERVRSSVSTSVKHDSFSSCGGGDRNSTCANRGHTTYGQT